MFQWITVFCAQTGTLRKSSQRSLNSGFVCFPLHYGVAVDIILIWPKSGLWVYIWLCVRYCVGHHSHVTVPILFEPSTRTAQTRNALPTKAVLTLVPSGSVFVVLLPSNLFLRYRGRKNKKWAINSGISSTSSNSTEAHNFGYATWNTNWSISVKGKA